MKGYLNRRCWWYEVK
nr:hypothetical protein [Bacillus sp. (in: firmicutes)]